MSQERFLLFTAGGEGFACQLQEISEVMEPQPSYPIPRAPQHFTGLINFHGALTALVDLASYLGRRSLKAGGKVLVLDSRRAALALKVEAVSSIVTREAILDELPGEDRLTQAKLITERGVFRLLRLETLLAELEGTLD